MPAAAATPEPTADLSLPEIAGPVLVVEDHPVNQEIAAALLEHLGLACEIVADGEAAVARVARAPRPALVLMDCRLPGIDGVEATRRAIREAACS